MAAVANAIARPSESSPARQFELLLACCSNAYANASPEMFAGFEGESFAELAIRHGVLPRVYERVASIGIPGKLRDTLRCRFETHTRRALCLTSELVRIIDHLYARDISVLPYKGPVLAQMLYGNIAARQFGDLDLLVRSSDVGRVKTALQELGFTPTLQLSARGERAYVRSGYEYVFDRGRERNLVELHWRVAPRFYAVDFDIDGLFERSVSVELAGRSIATLCPEDLLLVLCVHAAKHAWTNLSWLCDVGALADKVDWAVVSERARQLAIERVVAITFLLANTLLGAEISVISCDDHAASITNELAVVMREGRELDVESRDYFRLMTQVRERWRDRLRFVLRLAVTPTVTEWRSVRLPEKLFPLYTLVRVARVAARLRSGPSRQ